jgi:hypothetical protein
MTHPGFNPTYSDGEIYCLLRRVMTEHQADPSADVMQSAPTRAPAISMPGTRIKHDLSFDELLQKIGDEMVAQGRTQRGPSLKK